MGKTVSGIGARQDHGPAAATNEAGPTNVATPSPEGALPQTERGDLPAILKRVHRKSPVLVDAGEIHELVALATKQPEWEEPARQAILHAVRADPNDIRVVIAACDAQCQISSSDVSSTVVSILSGAVEMLPPGVKLKDEAYRAMQSLPLTDVEWTELRLRSFHDRPNLVAELQAELPRRGWRERMFGGTSQLAREIADSSDYILCLLDHGLHLDRIVGLLGVSRSVDARILTKIHAAATSGDLVLPDKVQSAIWKMIKKGSLWSPLQVMAMDILLAGTIPASVQSDLAVSLGRIPDRIPVTETTNRVLLTMCAKIRESDTLNEALRKAIAKTEECSLGAMMIDVEGLLQEERESVRLLQIADEIVASFSNDGENTYRCVIPADCSDVDAVRALALRSQSDITDKIKPSDIIVGFHEELITELNRLYEQSSGQSTPRDYSNRREIQIISHVPGVQGLSVAEKLQLLKEKGLVPGDLRDLVLIAAAKGCAQTRVFNYKILGSLERTAIAWERPYKILQLNKNTLNDDDVDMCGCPDPQAVNDKELN
jgi:hypothetical protein